MLLFNILKYFFLIRPFSFHHGMAHPYVVDGEDGFQMWKIVMNMLNKQWRAADKGWYSSLGFGRVDNSSQKKKLVTK